MKNEQRDTLESLMGFVLGLAFFGSLWTAWFTHIFATIKTEDWIFGVIGIIVPPVGIIHGLVIWFS